MTLETVFLFAGQGTQYHQMGRWMYENHGTFRRTLNDLDAVVREHHGRSILAQFYGPDRRPEEAFDRFRDTQPAIFMIEYALARALMAEGIKPNAVLGASLGEVAAAAVAGMVEPEQCLALLLRQVDLFEECCPPGGMLAVLAETELYHRSAELNEHSELAAVNSAANFVVAGRPDALDRVERWLTAQRVLHQRLPVSYAFHSTLIEPAEAGFKELVGGLRLRTAQIPLLSCTTGGEVTELDAEHLWQVLRRPFEVERVLNGLLRLDRHRYLDLSPSGSLANLVRSRLTDRSASRTFAVLSPFSTDGALWERVLADRTAADRSGFDAASGVTPAGPARTRRLRVVAFPGQGSQAKGMGRDLFDRFPALTALADEVLGYSIRTLCLDDPGRQLRQTEYTQPALYVVNALTYLKSLQEGARLPDYVLGHSLGEYDALFAAGAFDFGTGLRLVQRRGEVMSRAGSGSMAAVTGQDVETVRALLGRHGLDRIDVANFNSPTQTIIAGPTDAIDEAMGWFSDEGMRCVRIKVSAPFHSRYMASAAEEFGAYLDQVEIVPLKLPAISNVDGRPYGGPDDIRQKLCRQITGSVQWIESIRYLMRAAEREAAELDVVEMGPGQVLTGLVAQIRQVPLPPAPPPVAGPSLGAVVQPGSAPSTPASRPSTLASSPAAVVAAETLGSKEFREEHGVGYAYVVGGMHRGIASLELVAAMARAGMLSFLGSDGLTADQIAERIRRVRGLAPGRPFGLNLTYDPSAPGAERQVVDAALGNDIGVLEVATYAQITPELVRYRLRGSRIEADGRGRTPHRLLAKVTRPDIARLFLQAPPAAIVDRLRAQGALTDEEAVAGSRLPMADDICATGDSGGYTDLGVLTAVYSSIARLRDDVARGEPARKRVRVGAAGGIGTPEAVAAAFVLGADFVLTGSINLCTAESGLSDRVKDMLQELDVHDTAHAPFADLFELGGRARVMKKGVLFHARANRLYELWRHYDDWDQIDPAVRRQIEERYFQASFEEMYRERRREVGTDPGADTDPKRRLAVVFRWYCDRALRFAVAGEPGRELDYQVCCGPALGAANRWLAGTDLQPWRARHVDTIARRMMTEAAELLARWATPPA